MTFVEFHVRNFSFEITSGLIVTASGFYGEGAAKRSSPLTLQITDMVHFNWINIPEVPVINRDYCRSPVRLKKTAVSSAYLITNIMLLTALIVNVVKSYNVI